MMISDDNVTINQDYQISSQTQLSAVDSDFKRDGYKISYWTSNADGTGTRYDVDSIVNAAQVSDDLDFYAQWEKIVEQLLMTSINGNTYNFGYDKLPVSNVLNYKGNGLHKVMSPFSENSELSNPSNLLAVNDVGGGINTVESDSFSYNCQNLTAVYLQNVTVIEATSFSNCSNLQIVYCPNLSSLNSSAFGGCSNLSLLILSSYDGVCQNDYAFWGNNDYYTVYVKDEQYKNYITATNWDDISSHISSVTQPTVTFLSGDTYETVVKTEKLNYNMSAIPPEITKEGYELTGWDGDYKDVTCDTSCYAQWKVVTSKFNISAFVSPEGYGTVNNESPFISNDIEAGSTINLTAKKTYGHAFVDWSDGESQPERTVEMNATSSLTANFANVSADLLLGVNDSAKGSTIGSGLIGYSESRGISAVANYGYEFTGWTKDEGECEIGDVSLSATTLTSNSESQISVTANFKAMTLSVEYDAGYEIEDPQPVTGGYWKCAIAGHGEYDAIWQDPDHWRTEIIENTEVIISTDISNRQYIAEVYLNDSILIDSGVTPFGNTHITTDNTIAICDYNAN